MNPGTEDGRILCSKGTGWCHRHNSYLVNKQQAHEVTLRQPWFFWQGTSVSFGNTCVSWRRKSIKEFQSSTSSFRPANPTLQRIILNTVSWALLVWRIQVMNGTMARRKYLKSLPQLASGGGITRNSSWFHDASLHFLMFWSNQASWSNVQNVGPLSFLAGQVDLEGE